MANTKYPEPTHEQLLNEALDLLSDIQNRLGMFEKQHYWHIKLKAEKLNEKEVNAEK